MGGESGPVVAGRQPGDREPAPGSLALVQAFINTRHDLGVPGGGDLLASPAALRDWLGPRGLMGGGARVDEDALKRTVAVREGLRALAFANNLRGLDMRAVTALNAAAGGAAVEVRLTAGVPVFAASRVGEIDAAIGFLLALTAQAMFEGVWPRLKACPGRQCGWAFFDGSRNQSGRWCSMSVCGGRAKARAYHRRSARRGA